MLEADEDRDNPTFIAWDILSEMQLTEAHTELNNICERVKEGDRNAMLELIELTADRLLLFDTLPRDLKANLSDGLKEVSNALELNRGKKGFLPPLTGRGSGVLSKEKQRGRYEEWLLWARRVEYCRFKFGLSKEEAVEQVGEAFKKNAHTVNDYWKKAHCEAKELFHTADLIYAIVEKATGINPKNSTQQEKK